MTSTGYLSAFGEYGQITPESPPQCESFWGRPWALCRSGVPNSAAVLCAAWLRSTMVYAQTA